MRVRLSPRPPIHMRAWRNKQTRLAQDQCQLAGSSPAVRTMLRLPMVRLTVSKAVTGGSNPPRSAKHCKPMASAPAATRWNAVRFRGSAPTEGAKRRQRLLVSKTRAPQGWGFDSSALRQLSGSGHSLWGGPRFLVHFRPSFVSGSTDVDLAIRSELSRVRPSGTRAIPSNKEVAIPIWEETVLQ